MENSLSNILNDNSNNNQNIADEFFYLFRNEINNKIDYNLHLENSDTGLSNLIKEENIDNTKVSDNNKPNNNLLGRKKKSHTKYDFDNIFKKIKSTLLVYLLNFINMLIKKIYNDNIGHDIFLKQLLRIDNKEFSSIDNKEILNKTLKDIFSENSLSKKYSKYNENHNKYLIEQLLNEEDEEKRVFFNKLFDLTFIKCLKHFSGSEIIEELNGLFSLDNFLNKFEDDREYQENVKFYISQIEEIMERKRKKTKVKN